MGLQSTTIAYSPLQSVDSALFTGAFIPLGGATPHEARIFKLVNNSNVLVTISTDGVTPMDVLPASSFTLYDTSTNRSHSAPMLNLPSGTQFYASGPAGTGLVYLVVLYANTPNNATS
jgi:hypothetical protein